MGLKEAFRYMTSDQVVMPHRYPMYATLKYFAPQGGQEVALRVIGRIVRENHSGVAVSYRCRQIRDGQILRDTIEVDEFELSPAEGVGG